MSAELKRRLTYVRRAPETQKIETMHDTSSRAFVPAPRVIASATTPGITPHVYLQTPGRDPLGVLGYSGHKIATDGTDKHPL